MTLLLFCEMILARDSLSAWRRNNPTSELSPINSRVLCGPRPKAAAVTSVHPQPLGCPIVTGTLARSLDARAPASTQRKCIRSGQFAFSGKDEQNANPRAALLWRPNVCSWFCSWSAALLHQHITCYLRKLICFCTMGFFVLFCLLSYRFQLPGLLFFLDMGMLRPVYSHQA